MKKDLTKYPASAYDDSLCLKLSGGMWLTLLFLLRPYLVLVLSLVDMQDRTRLIYLFYGDQDAFALGSAAALPAVAVLVAWVQRRADAGNLVRRVWNLGRALLLVSAVLGLAIVVFTVVAGGGVPHLLQVTQAVLAVYVIAYLYRSDRARDTFADFP